MSVVMFATLCDCCQKRSEEYGAWPTCRECGAHTCEDCDIATERRTDIDCYDTLCIDCQKT